MKDRVTLQLTPKERWLRYEEQVRMGHEQSVKEMYDGHWLYQCEDHDDPESSLPLWQQLFLCAAHGEQDRVIAMISAMTPFEAAYAVRRAVDMAESEGNEAASAMLTIITGEGYDARHATRRDFEDVLSANLAYRQRRAAQIAPLYADLESRGITPRYRLEA
jgi:hypothetical protein